MLFTDLPLAQRLEGADAQNGIECACRRPDAAFLRIAGGVAIFAGLGSVLTRALGGGMNGPLHETELDDLENFFRSRGAPVVLELCPFADPSLVELIGRRHYRICEFNNILVRSVTGLEPGDPDWSLPRVREIAPNEGDLWALTIAQGFSECEIPAEEEIEIGRTVAAMPSARCLLAFDGENAAAAGAIFVHEGVALLFSDSTIPRFRRRGMQTALIRRRLELAALANCDVAAASVAPGTASQRSYERCGFQVAYTKVVLMA